MWTHDDKKPMPHAHCKHCLGAIGTHRSDCPGAEIDRLEVGRDQWRERAMRAEAAIARVEELLDGHRNVSDFVLIDSVRAALDGSKVDL